MIEFLDDQFNLLNQTLTDYDGCLVMILVDDNTAEFCLPALAQKLRPEIRYEVLKISSGEEHKNIQTAINLWEQMIQLKADRNALLINLGGGVITDMGGFVASTYKRGIRFINIPTTLLAMVDASIGGKTGIDHQFYKNVIGTFSFPQKIFCYPDFLKTLPFVQLRSGFAEMLKHGLISSTSHWEDLKNLKLSAENIKPFVLDSMKIKQSIVEQDFKESGIRKILNFGHTFGHAVESLFLKSNHIIPHGEGVAAGALMESYLSSDKHSLTPQELDEINLTISRVYPKLDLTEFSNQEIFSLMLNDKKNLNGQIQFSVPDAIGHCLYNQTYSKSAIFRAIDFYRQL